MSPWTSLNSGTSSWELKTVMLNIRPRLDFTGFYLPVMLDIRLREHYR